MNKNKLAQRLGVTRLTVYRYLQKYETNKEKLPYDVLKVLEEELNKEIPSLENEIWKDVDNTNGIYRVSNMGRVISKMSGSFELLHPRNDQKGYARVDIFNKTVRLHRLVATAFIPNPDNKRTVNHINGQKSDNRASNLEWATHKENIAHAYKECLAKNEKPVLCIMNGIPVARYRSIASASRKLGINSSNICTAIKKHKRAYGCYWEYES